MSKLSILLLFISLAFFQQIMLSQDKANFEKAQTYLQNKGEVYFMFNISNKTELQTITKTISIDNVKGNTVWAYANKVGFANFLKLGYNYTVLSHPGELLQNASMYTGEKGVWQFDTYPTYTEYESMMQTFAAYYPSICKLYDIGTTVQGRKLLFVKISKNVNSKEAEPRFMYTSTMHGDETTGFIMMLRLINHLLSNYGINSEVTNIIDNCEIWINPNANPDGTYRGGNSTVSGAVRFNANNIDLNRNYPCPDPNQTVLTPIQPETQAMINFMDTLHFDMSANFHGGAELMNFPWDTWYSSQKTHADDSWWRLISREYVDTARIYKANYMTDTYASGITEGADWYPAYGSRQDYFTYFTLGRELTVEISTVKNLSASQLTSYWGYNYRSLILYIKQSMYGLRGTVKDACSNNPIKAKVFINSHDRDSSHVYSNSENGAYFRPILAGSYSVTYSAAGYTSKTVSINVANFDTTIKNISLAPIAPTAAFTQASNGCTVYFTCTTPNASSYLWNFGDGTTSTLQNPSHSYATPGNYNVTLTVTNCINSNQTASTISVNPQVPVAVFSANNTSSCDGIIAFSNASTSASSYLWNFGDGTTSTLQNPVHTYTNAGIYTVALTATNCAGSATETKTSYINATIVSPPVISNNSRCGNGVLTISGSSQGTIMWYDSQSGGNQLASGNTFTTPYLTNTTTYFAEASNSFPIQTVGSNDSTINGSYSNTSASGLLFTVYKSMKLISVVVNAQSTGSRTISLTDASGNTIESLTVNIPAGISRVTLNFNIQPGSYRLMGSASSLLWRNNAAITYPYSISNLVSITGATTTNRYFFFYNWKVQETGCTSQRIPVVANVNSDNMNIAFSASQTNLTSQPFTAQFSNTTPASGNLNFTWHFGDGSTETNNNPSVAHTYANAGTYSVTLIAENTTTGCIDTLMKNNYISCINTGYTLSGTVVYNNTAGTPMPNINLTILNGTNTVATTTTDLNGNFSFSGINNGTYNITSNVSLPWSGVTSTDVLKIKRHIAGLETITEPIRISASDVNVTGNITSTDALKIQRRLVGLDASFTCNDWFLEKPATGGNSIIINSSNITQNFYSLCAADANGSNIPAVMAKTGIRNIDYITVSNKNNESEYADITINKGISIGAFQLFIDYPEDLIDITEVNMPGNEEQLVFYIHDGIIKTSFANLNPINTDESNTILRLKIKNIPNTDNTPVVFNILPESEFADQNGNILNNYKLNATYSEQYNFMDKVKINYFPNPFDNEVTISVNANVNGTAQIFVTDISGKNILMNSTELSGRTTNNILLNTSNLSNGFYICKIEISEKDSKYTRVFKLQKQ